MARQLTNEQDVRDLIKKLQGAGVFDDKTSKRIEEKSGSRPYGDNVDGKFVPFRNDEVAARGSYYGDDVAEKKSKRDEQRYASAFAVPRLSSEQSAGLAKEYGLQGIADDQFSGLTRAEANEKARLIREGKLEDVTANTSSVFSPEAIAGTKKKFNDLTTRLDEWDANPWDDKNTKLSRKKSDIESFAKDVAGMFNTQEEFEAAKQNGEFGRFLEQYEQLGGSPAEIQANIAQPTFEGMGGPQSLDQYLGEADTEAERLAMESLIPEKKVAQERIALEAGIVNNLIDQYFGTEEQIGYLEREKKLADERIELIKKQAKDAENNANAQAELMSQRYEFEQKKASATIEKNRLQAQNYMTERLASLGALKTSGKAGEAVVKINQDYQKQKQELDMEYSFEQKALDIKLNETIKDIDNTRDEAILSIKEDLSKSENDVMTEVFEAQQKAQREALKIVDNFSRDYRSQTDKYRKELEKKAKEWTEKYANTITDKDVANFEEGQFFKNGDVEGVVNPFGEVVPYDITPTQQREIDSAGIRGEDAMRTFVSYPNDFREWYIQQVQTGGLSKGVSLPVLNQRYNQWLSGEDRRLVGEDSTKIYYNSGDTVTESNTSDGKSARQKAKEAKAAEDDNQ